MKVASKLLFILSIYLLLSCQTNKIPKWVTDPPGDDIGNIYFVGYGRDDNFESKKMESLAFDSIINQIYERFGIEPDEYLDSLFLGLLKDSYSLTDDSNGKNLSVVDRWSDDDELYILVKIKKKFILPLMEAFLSSSGEQIFISDLESNGDLYFKDGLMFRALNSYLEAAKEMLKSGDEEYYYPIIRALDKALRIIKPIKYSSTEVFSEIIINEALIDKDSGLPGKRLFFTLDGVEGMDYSGFIYNVSFVEGWENREREAEVSVVKNNLEFVPPVAKTPGVSYIKSELNLSYVSLLLKPWENGHSLSYYIRDFLDLVDTLVKQSRISFNYTVKEDFHIRPKVISFNNALTTEGVIRYLLEKDEYSEVGPSRGEDKTLLDYVRDVNIATEDMFSYLIIGEVLSVESENYDDGVLYKHEGEFSIIDLKTSRTLITQSVKSEFLGVIGEDDLAYLDLGLKIGEIISQLNF